NSKKPLNFSGFCRCSDGDPIAGQSKPLGPASVPTAVPVIPVSVEAGAPIRVAVHFALEPAVAPSFPVPEPVHGQDGEPALLAVIERLVERVGGVGDLLHGRRAGSHVVGALTQPR